jgi:eukaryotic-like serine/threonine-protein kinase
MVTPPRPLASGIPLPSRKPTVSAADATFIELQAALAGRYSLDREVGRGGMGIVYRALEVRLDRPVAIKVLRPDRATPDMRTRFLREARLAARLSHPNIIPIHAVEESAGFVYFAMAFVDGETLTQRVRSRGPLGATEGTRVLREVAWALEHAHEQGLVHRDVKPDNVLIERASGRVLVADFGIAAAAGDESADGVAGTPEFMSPEQILGQHLDQRSDIYSLGATAFYAFSGRYPFEGSSPTEVLSKHVGQDPPPLASLGRSVPRRVAVLVDRCLAKALHQRPRTAQQLADELGLALEQRRELPIPLRAFVRRTARLDGGGTLIGVSAISTAVAGAWSMWGPLPALATLAASALLPFGYFITSARRLSHLGFSHRDLPAAFRAELEQTEEEMSLAISGTPTWPERMMPAVMRISTALVVCGIAGIEIMGRVRSRTYPFDLSKLDTWAWQQLAFSVANGALMAGGLALPLALVGYLALGHRRKDLDTAFWAKLWQSPIGRLAFAVGRKLLGKHAAPAALTHRATELSLGLAAEQLFDSLPRNTRRALGDVPAVLRRLQVDASSLRAHCDALQEALVASDSTESETFRELCTMRDAMQQRLGHAVAALETIRLDLLRLHAGTDSVASLTTHLGLAAEVSDAVSRMAAAREDVERLLRFPREEVATPV